jgi:pimeloyl-ACP methyl ester carboxylesterase
MDFKVYYLHGLGSSCEGTKAVETRKLVEKLGGEFNCKTLNYLRKGFYPWDVQGFLVDWVELDKPTYLIGSSMGAYTWLDFLCLNPDILDRKELAKVILITPPTTLFEDLEKWSPLYGKEKVFFLYGEHYIYDYKTFIELMYWDIKHANYRLLKLPHSKVVSILAKLDTVVNNEPIYELAKYTALRYYELEDEHPLKNSISQLMEILEKEIKSL